MNQEKPIPKDDQDWLDVLAGHEVPDADPKTRREAELIRAAILAHHADDSSDPTAEETEHAWQQLQFRLRRERKSSKPKPFWQRREALVALAATVAAVVIVPKLALSPDMQPKDLADTQFIVSEDPRQEAEELAQTLTRLGLQPEITQQNDDWYIDVRLPDPLTEEVRTALDVWRLKIPEDQRLLVLITAP